MANEPSEPKSSLKSAITVTSAYVCVQLISAISSLQVVSVLGKALDAGTFIYPIAFTLRDLCQKVLGKKGVRHLIVCSAAGTLAMSLAFWLIGKLPINEDAGGSVYWASVLTPVWRLTLASILAGLVSELADTEVYSWWTEKVTTKHQWARVLVSNLVSIPLDSLIFSMGAFYGTMPNQSVFEIFYGNLIIKYLVTVVSLPMIYGIKENSSTQE